MRCAQQRAERRKIGGAERRDRGIDPRTFGDDMAKSPEVEVVEMLTCPIDRRSRRDVGEKIEEVSRLATRDPLATRDNPSRHSRTRAL